MCLTSSLPSSALSFEQTALIAQSSIDTLEFDQLAVPRCVQLTVVTSDGADDHIQVEPEPSDAEPILPPNVPYLPGQASESDLESMEDLHEERKGRRGLGARVSLV